MRRNLFFCLQRIFNTALYYGDQREKATGKVSFPYLKIPILFLFSTTCSKIWNYRAESYWILTVTPVYKLRSFIEALYFFI
jgi:hypothetical protein